MFRDLQVPQESTPVSKSMLTRGWLKSTCDRSGKIFNTVDAIVGIKLEITLYLHVVYLSKVTRLILKFDIYVWVSRQRLGDKFAVHNKAWNIGHRYTE